MAAPALPSRGFATSGVRFNQAPHLPRDPDEQALTVYRYLGCEGIYNLYSGTLFEKKHLRPSEVVMLLRGVVKGESSIRLAEEVGVSRTTVHELRKELQTNADHLQPEAPSHR